MHQLNNPQFMNENDTITAGYQKISLKASKKSGFLWGLILCLPIRKSMKKI
jgi:hypothetical protein